MSIKQTHTHIWTIHKSILRCICYWIQCIEISYRRFTYRWMGKSVIWLDFFFFLANFEVTEIKLLLELIISSYSFSCQRHLFSLLKMNYSCSHIRKINLTGNCYYFTPYIFRVDCIVCAWIQLYYTYSILSFSTLFSSKKYV